MSDESVRVNLHCHSTLSDGALPPEDLARMLAADKVSYASLTDHDTCEGSRRFRQELLRLGIGCVDGVEITAASNRCEVHLLAYGIDAENQALREALAGERRRNDPGMQGLVDSMKRIRGRSRAPRTDALSSAEAIRLAHAAGGAVFLAHPLSYGLEEAALADCLDALISDGLDGIEALYAPYPEAQTRLLERIAGERGLAVCGGSDFHERGAHGQAAGVAMSGEQWKGFRDLLLRAPRGGPALSPDGSAPSRRRRLGAKRGAFTARIVLPTLLAIVLFVVSIFAVIIPRFEAILLERKKELIRELTNSVVSILAEYAADEAAGRTSREQAERDAAARIRDIRYGKEGKDYFWITDMRPTMIVHPYRADLVGADVSGYADANGVRVFVEFVNAVRERSEGYVEYLWQWKDDSHRIVPKLSFVKRFPPWDWVVGTGIYLDDVRAEIDRMARRLIVLSIVIVVLLSLLLAFVAQQSLAIERGRTAAESALHDSLEKYRALVEASTEGMVIVIGGACTYANATFLEMAGYSESELPLLAVAELFLPAEGRDEGAGGLLAALDSAPAENAGPLPCECLLRTRSGALIDAVLTASRFALAGRDGWILSVKDLGARRRSEAAREKSGGPYAALAESAAMGMFRSTWGRRAWLLEANPAARRLFGIGADRDLTQVNLLSLVADPADAERLSADLETSGAVSDREILLARPDGESLTISLSAALAKDEPGPPRLEGIAIDVSKRLADELRREELLAETEASSLYLSESAAKLASAPAAVGMNTPIRAAAARMSRDSCDALLVAGPAGEVLGIVTNRDIRERVVAEGRDPALPVREIMSSPLLSIPDSALLFEALLLMREKDMDHLAVRNPSGAITGILRGKDLLQLHRQSLAVMSREIGDAGTAEEVAECRRRLPDLLHGLIAGGARPASVARILAAISDMIVQRLVQLALGELGEPPAPFAFLALGSLGREEQTLGSDQDNAILHGGRPGEPYFLSLGEKVCSWLDGMGVPHCPGGIMAKNPAWCAPLAEWEQCFARWIRLPEEQQLLDFNIFFDFRCVAGERGLADGLRRSIAALLLENPPFFLHLAQDALRRKLPPLFAGGALRELLRAGPAELDLKEAMAPVVTFARLYALRHGIEATNTLARLAALRKAGVLSPQLHEQLSRAYGFLGEMRLRCQEEKLRATGAPSDRLDTRGLEAGDEARLRHAVAQVGLLQKRISFDYLGSAL